MSLGRRDFLRNGVGLLTMAASCRPQADVAHIAGKICGPSFERGHLLRDGGETLRSRPPDPQRRAGVVILGGGVAGLSAAWRLHRAGYDDFVVLELEDEAGGTARSSNNAVTPFPWGAHYLPVPSRNQPALCELLRELDVLEGYDAGGRAICGEAHLCRAPQERIFYKGRWYEGLYLRAGASAEDLRQFERFHDEVGRWVRAVSPDGRRVFTLPHRGAARLHPEAAALDQQTMAEYLSRLGLTSPRLRFYVDYACRDDFGLRMTAASAWAGIHYYAARLLHPDDAPPEVLTWPEGNGWLIKRLLACIDAKGSGRVKTGCLALDVRRLAPANGDERVEVLYLDLNRAAFAKAQQASQQPVSALRARHVIFALPTFLRPHLISDLRHLKSPPSWLRRFSYAPWLVANLTLRRTHSAPVGAGHKGGSQPGGNTPDLGFPACWDNVLLESPSLGYVVATHQREPAPKPDGIPRTVFTYYLPLCDAEPSLERERLLRTPWSTFRDAILGDLGRAEPNLAAQVERLDIFRWGHGMVRPLPGLFTSADDALAAAAAPLDDIFFAHTDLAGMALFEEAHHAGVAAAEDVLRKIGHPFDSFCEGA